jgi:hypothetical protein
MNTFTKGLIAILLSTILLSADTINEQIEAIQKATPQERAELMNALKKKLASMNEEERANAINTLQTEIGGKAINTGTCPPMQLMQQIQSTRQENSMQGTNNTFNPQFPRMRR